MFIDNHGKRMNIQEMVVFLFIFTPTYSEKSCLKHKWIYSEEANRYIYIEFVRKTFADAAQHCLSMGAELLMVKNAGTDTFMREYFDEKPGVSMNHEFEYYWMGMRMDDGSETTRRWIDGTALDKDAFQQWQNNEPYVESENESRGLCVAIRWYKSNIWRKFWCDSTFFVICQTLKPCAARPVISVNNARVLENTSMTVRGEEMINVKCLLQGYDELIANVTLICEAENSSRVDWGSKFASFDIRLGFQMNGKRCICRSRDGFKHFEESFVTFGFIFSPRLANNQSAAIQTFTVTQDTDFTTKLEVIASPDPNTFSLFVTGLTMDNTSCVDYSVKVGRSSPVLHTNLTFRLKKVPVKCDGWYYSLKIGNGVKDDFVWTFKLTVNRHPDLNAIFAIVGTAILCPLAILLILLIRKGRTSRRQRMQQLSTH